MKKGLYGLLIACLVAGLSAPPVSASGEGKLGSAVEAQQGACCKEDGISKDDSQGELSVLSAGELTFSASDSYELSDIRGSQYNKTFTGGDGKYSLMIFGGISSCSNCQAATTAALELAEAQGAENLNVYIIDIQGNSKEDLLPYAEGAPGNVLFASTSEGGAAGSLYRKCYFSLAPSGFSMPLVAYVDPQGTVFQSTQGYEGASTGVMLSNLAEGGLTLQKKIINVAYHTQEEIRAFVKETGATLQDPVLYEEEPLLVSPYGLGKVSEQTLQSALNMLNQIRYIAGLSYNVTLDETMNEKCQAGMLVNYANGQLTHYPEQPADMSDELYRLGCQGTSQSNIAWASWQNRSLNDTLVNGWMNDGDFNNISRMGHRRWLLNPTLGKTGFGVVSGSKGTYGAVFVFDWSNTGARESGVVWPAQNMPAEYFSKLMPWTLSTGDVEDADSVSIELVRANDGRTWRFSSQSADGYFGVNNGGYGQAGCVIFRPDGVDTYQAGDTYQVTVKGLVAGETSYQVHFFDLEEAVHVHSLTLIPANEATCTTDGNQQYYRCGECGKYFKDAEGSLEITDLTAMTIPASHKIHHVEAEEATCTTNGNLAYYECTVCGKKFRDQAGNEEITDEGSLIIPAAHEYSADWSSDELHHWHACTKCDSERKDYGEHTYGSVKDTDCNICGYVRELPDRIVVEEIFRDVKAGQWYVPFIQYVYENGIMNGKSAATFGTVDNLTRAEFAQVLYNMENKPEVEISEEYSDVTSGNWYAKAVSWAHEKDIANGYGNGTFGVNDNITREQLALMLYKYAGLKGYSQEGDPEELMSYSDPTSISSWAGTAMSWAVSQGIISGKKQADGSYRLDPTGKATRAECATMLKNFNKAFEQ